MPDERGLIFQLPDPGGPLRAESQVLGGIRCQHQPHPHLLIGGQRDGAWSLGELSMVQVGKLRPREGQGPASHPEGGVGMGR